MSRIAEYFCVLGVEDKTDLYDGKELKGCLDQRFPEKDWKKSPCPHGLEHFCQPGGWFATQKNKPPTFYLIILTDMEGNPNYLACLTFHEAVPQDIPTPNRVVGDSCESKYNSVKMHAMLYVPKCICIISHQRCYTTLKNCLTTIFSAYLNGESALIEKMIGCMIGFVVVPPPGGPKLTFSIGGGDSQVLQPPLSADLPSTHESVAILFNQLGIHSMLLAFTALVTESKILLLSSSYTHLTVAAEALVSLLYPLRFSYVFIPTLPSTLLDFLTAPTPFLMGVHMSYEEHIPELFDVVIVNIDEGYVTVPDSIHLATIPQPYYSQLLTSLKMILTPSLFNADLLFPTPDTAQTLALQDKELRAVFIKLFAEMFCGYRACLTLIRVHPQPIISFNKIAFMEKRGFAGDDFFIKVLESVSFSTMTQERGPPYRVVDMFDELVANVVPTEREKSAKELLEELIPIVDHLCQNEPSFDNPEVSTIPVVPIDCLSRPLKAFPLLNEIQVNSYISGNAPLQGKSCKGPIPEPRQVPISTYDHPKAHFINQRRLEVIKDCVQYIYENKISEARKAMPSVLRALKSKGAQLALCNELELRVKHEKSALLEHDQYNLIVRLLNASLQDDNSVNNTSVAIKIIPLVAAFHRKMGPSVTQFAYTSVQEHAIWNSIQFWEEAFYVEAQRQIVELHVKERQRKFEKLEKAVVEEKVSKEETKKVVKKTVSHAEIAKITFEKTFLDTTNGKSNRNSMLLTPVMRNRTMTRGSASNISPTSPDEDDDGKKKSLKDLPNAMKLAADLLSEWGDKTEEEKERLVYEEESIVYSLTMLFAQQMMCLRVPTNACVEMRKLQQLRKQEYERRMQQQLAGPGQAGDSSQSSVTEDNLSVSIRPANSVVAGDAASTYMADSVMEGSSGGWDSMHDLGDIFDYGESVKDTTVKFILRFVERVCIEAGVTAAHLKHLQTNIPMLVGMHIESLEEVYRETKDAPTHKAKILKPALLPGEKPQFDGLRCYLIPDGRELGVPADALKLKLSTDPYDNEREMDIGSINGGPSLLPAEGALFLTNYRVIFKGTPVDQFASEMTVTRSFPIGSLLKEKKVRGLITVYPGQTVDGCLQLRSSTVQIMKLAFDEEVLPESVENLRKALVRSRWTQSVYYSFVFNYKAPPMLQRTLSQRQQSIKKTHRTLNSVVNYRKIVTGASGRKYKLAIAEDSTTRKYESVNKDSVTSDEDELKMHKQVLLEQENRGVDRLRESVLCKDYERVGLACISKITASPWRVSMANFHYTACRSYPSIVIVPSHITDDTVLKVAKNHQMNRFPVAIWRHKRTKGTLLRSGAIHKSVLAAVLKAGLDGESHRSSSVTEDEKFFSEIVNATHLYSYKGKGQTVSSGAALSMQAMSDDFATMFNGSDNFKNIADELSEIKNWQPAHLYIFTDKGAAKGTKMVSSTKVVVVNVELHDVQQVKTSFMKLVKVCCPSNPSAESNFLSALEDSKWMSQISSLLQIACSIVNLIDIQGSSCLISFGDGSEVTTQIISLVQILSDPYYRKIEGFKYLIEKDWLAFGYRFSYRGNHVLPLQQNIAPFFLQFLDCVHQIVCQYPHAFEFNNYFLKLIAHHQTSMRFNTFLLDSQQERHQNGWFMDSNTPKEQLKIPVGTSSKQRQLAMKGNLSRNRKDATLKAEQLEHQKQEQKQKKAKSVSLWDYLEVQSSRFTLFQSFMYHPNLSKGVLQPFCNISNLNIWEYFTEENLYTGPTYDLELIPDFEMANPSHEASIGSHQPEVDREDSQQCFTGCYGSTKEFPRDEGSYLLCELIRLKEELDQSTKMWKWKTTWNDLNVKDVLKRQTRSLFNWHNYWVKERRVAMHKRLTIDMVMKGKVTDNSQVTGEFGFEYPHNFIYHNYIMSSICNYCLQTIAGLHSGLQCTQCMYNVHDKCQSMVPAQCPKHQHLIDQPAVELSRSVHSLQGREISNQRNFKGTLYKRGNLLRQWKARWFVLDTERNHLTYFDSEEDNRLQGYIDLGEMRACRKVGAPHQAPKWGDPRSYFELETAKRCYYLLALRQEDAQDWVDRLNALNV